jgi:flagellin-specific chaperone FliS
MLLALYDRTIENVQVAEAAYSANESQTFVDAQIAASQCILGLYEGLDTKEESAQNVARLLHFVAGRLEEKDFAQAIKFLQRLRDSFAQVRDEANTLEQDGKIPAFNGNYSFDRTV